MGNVCFLKKTKEIEVSYLLCCDFLATEFHFLDQDKADDRES